MKEVFEHGARNDEAGGKSLKVVLKVLSTVLNGEPAGTRTQDPRLKSTSTSEINQQDHSSESSDE